MIWYLLIGFFLSIDAFIVLFVYSSINKYKIKLLPFIIGSFHILFPIITFYISDLIVRDDSQIYNLISPLIFIVLGIQQIIIKEDEIKPIRTYINLILLAVGVSIDSALIGVSLRLNETYDIFRASITFGIISFTISYISIYTSSKLERFIKGYNLNYISGLFFIMLGILCYYGIF